MIPDFSHHQVIKQLDPTFLKQLFEILSQIQQTDRPRVIIKATEGMTYVDPSFSIRASAFLSQGFQVEAYHFEHPLVDPWDQVDWHLNALKQFPAIKRSWLDLEDIAGQGRPEEWAQLSLEAIHQKLRAYLSKMDASGLNLGIYTGHSWIEQFLPTGGEYLGQYDLWQARYGPELGALPYPWKICSLWQFSCTGVLPGIQGYVDLSRLVP